MGRGSPRLPETVDQARDVLANQEFFVPRSELPAETDARRAYVRRLHIVLAKTARRFEHSKRVVAGEQSPDSDPELPGNLSEAEAFLEGRSFFVPVADLPDDPDRIGEYVETLHLRLARAARALTHNRRVLREREGSGDGDDTSGEAVGERHTSTDEQSTTGDETDEQSTAGDETDEQSTTGADGSADSVSAPDSETADEVGRAASGPTSAGSQTDGSAGSQADGSAGSQADGSARDDAETAPGQDTEEETGTDPTEESGGKQRDRFVYGQLDRPEDDEPPADDTVDRSGGDSETDSESEGEARPRGLDEIDETSTGGTGDVAGTEDETGSRTPDRTEETGLERRQLLFGGATVAVLVAAVGGGLAALLSDGGDGDTDGSTDQANGGDTDGTTLESADGDGTADDTGSTADGGDSGDSTDDGTDENWTFELADFEADATPPEEYVELAYAGEAEQDISGYRLYDGEDGRAHPTEPNSLDPFSFPDGTVLSPGGSVRVYTGPGESGDGVFYWGYEVNIWNQDGDTVVLEDTTGSVVFESRYGPQG